MTASDLKAPGCWQRISRIYTALGLLLLNTVGLLLLVEFGAALILAVRPRATLEQEIADFKAKMLAQEYYAGQDWATLYWDEHFQIVDNWSYAPYVLWQTRPFAGSMINVDEHGIRKTLNSNCGETSYRIYSFGGSTMWGYGVPDNFTIASYIQDNLQGRDVCVVNHGEVGFNSTQGLFSLLRLIQQGDIPDMVLFYDGSNDITIANRTGEAGGHFYLENIQPVVKGELVKRNPNAFTAALRQVVSQTATYRLLAGEPQPPQPNWTQPPFDPTFLEAVTSTYLTNIQTAAKMGETYHFRFYAFLQPVLPLVDRAYTEQEQVFIWETPGGLVDLFKAVYPRWQAAVHELPCLHDLTHILDEAELPVWIDFNHLTAWGNLMVANEILNVIRPVVDNNMDTAHFQGLDTSCPYKKTGR